jgi:hypothetical protein
MSIGMFSFFLCRALAESIEKSKRRKSASFQGVKLATKGSASVTFVAIGDDLCGKQRVMFVERWSENRENRGFIRTTD